MRGILWALVVAVVVGCGPTVHSGKVIEKQYSAPWIQWLPIHHADGGVTMIPIQHSAQYWVVVYGKTDKTAGEQWAEGRIYLDYDHWNDLRVGDFVHD